MSDFEDLPEYQLHLKTLSVRDDLYRSIFGVNIDIKRFEYGEKFILDKEFHIDVQLTLKNGSILLGQEKVLHPQFSHYNTFTMEFLQNRQTGERGEFFNIASQFYFHGYATKECKLEKYVIVDLLKFVDWSKDKTLNDLKLSTRMSGPSNATFYYIRYEKIPEDCLLYSHNIHHEVIKSVAPKIQLRCDNKHC